MHGDERQEATKPDATETGGLETEVGGRPGAIRIASVATASPDCRLTQGQVADFLAGHYREKLAPRSIRLLRRIFAHPSIAARDFAFSGPEEATGESRDERQARFASAAIELGARAARRALEAAAVPPESLAALVVNTCTGYLCPGLSGYIIERLGLQPDVQAYDLVGAGCAGALPALEMAAGALAAAGRRARGDGGGGAGGRAALAVSVEICSAAFRMDDDPSLIVSNALFADGAAAAVLREGPGGGLRLTGFARRLHPEHREAIRFVHRNGELSNQLAPGLPGIVARAASGFVPGFLAGHGLAREDIARWIVHPGGERVLVELARALGLPDGKLRESRAVLAARGNLSSASVWFVLRQAMDEGLLPGEKLVMLAFGAGLAMHACLLENA